MSLTIHWSVGGTTTVPTNLSTVEAALGQFQGNGLSVLASDDGEPLWMLAVKPGAVSALHAELLDPDEHTITVPAAMVDACRHEIAGLIECGAATEGLIDVLRLLIGDDA